MPDDPRIMQLLEQIVESGRAPDEVCSASPELLPAVLEGLRRFGAVQAAVSTMFPAGSQTGEAVGVLPPLLGPELPNIPGYAVLSVLGHGGMGVVYKARHLSLTRYVAIKMLLSGDYAPSAELARFMREAQAIAVLRHPHIIQVFDVGDLGGRPYFTMEYVEGGSLAQKLAGVPQPARDAASLVATLAEAIQVAHASGIIHRDLKPSNILLTADGVLKISDFGLALRSGEGPDLTLGGTRLGTPSYMSPEQTLGRRGTIGPSADIYSLGAVLYEMLTGRPPFKAETPAETERQVIAEDPAPPSKLNARVPRDLETICLKCLRKDATGRYASASALADDLHRFLRGEPVAARRAGHLERVGKWARRHPARTSALAGAVVAAAAVMGTLLWVAAERAAITRAVGDDLGEAVRLERASDWPASRNMLERAKTRLLSGSGRSALKLRASAIERDLDLVDRLAAMRLERAASEKAEFDKDEWWGAYRDKFIQAGLLHDGDAPADFAERVANAPARAALVDAMDDWSICAPPDKLAWVLSATQLADTGSAWQRRARDIKVWRDGAALVELAREAPVETESVTLLLMVAGRTLDADPEVGMGLLRRTQAAHPSDFWANFALAETLNQLRDADAIAFARVAVALRPGAAAAHFTLAEALDGQRRFDEAIESMNRAIALDPDNWKPHHNLAVTLGRSARFEEAVEQARIALRLHPNHAYSEELVGHGLKALGRYEEAEEAYRRAVDLSPEGTPERARFVRSLTRCQKAAASTKSPAPTAP